MNILLVSQCTKQALVQTRRILDQFAERRGERTWQTAITQAGLDTLRKLLRQTARKNTAVACHWIRGKDHTELLWVVGNRSQFNEYGAVPTHSTSRDVLRQADENNWHNLSLINLLSGLAALLHDLGKSCQSFQARLKPGSLPEKNRYRHEWVSVRLFQAFVGPDDDQGWLHRLMLAGHKQADAHAFEQVWLGESGHVLYKDGLDQQTKQHRPFAQDGSGLPPLAQAIAWLVLTHHRLPACPDEQNPDPERRLWHGKKPYNGSAQALEHLLAKVNADWNEPWLEVADKQAIDRCQPYWHFPHGLPVRTLLWRQRAARFAKALQSHVLTGQDLLHDPYVMHLSRLSLMLADHYYSGLKKEEHRLQGEKNFPLYANTDRATGHLLQPLDEHLLGVEHQAGKLVHSLPSLRGQLPHLIAHRKLKKRSADARFHWQDKAADLAVAVRQESRDCGAFIVNMASTGCGKTLANARIMNALTDPALGLRCAFAIGLRTLTLQTGRSFQTDLGLDEDALAIQVGGSSQKALFEYYEQLAERSGSASRQSLIDESSHVIYDSNTDHPALKQLAHEPGAQKLLSAPLLVCTIDHLTPATESLRGGRQIAPMLRLLTGDLVLDEPDDFDLDDLPALTRLVHWAGLLGSRVLLSSATLAPALVQGLYLAYAAGRRWFQRNRGLRPDEPVQIACLWVDEFHQVYVPCRQAHEFEVQHHAFVQKRVQELGQQVVRRRAELLALPANMAKLSKHEQRIQFAQVARLGIFKLHKKNHSQDPHSGKRVSFGLLRMANINPLCEVALALYQAGMPDGVQLHVCVYHSQYPLVMRSAIEHMLDQVMNRRQPQAVFNHPLIRQKLDQSSAQDHLFLVVGSPVAEVGRDHDYDWAVVEPSSMRSIIQLAGRVRRHRSDQSDRDLNILLCNANLLHFSAGKGKPAFCRPGFEGTGPNLLESHYLASVLQPLVDEKHQFCVDARPRILPRALSQRQPRKSLVDLEHARLETQMLPREKNSSVSTASSVLNASSFWAEPQAHLLGFVQQMQPFREQTSQQVELVFLPDEDEILRLHKVQDQDRYGGKQYVPVDASLKHAVSVPEDKGAIRWQTESLEELMQRQAQEMDLSLEAFAYKFGMVSVGASENGWVWSEALGFSRKG